MNHRHYLSIGAISATLLTLSAVGRAAFTSAESPHVTFAATGPAGFKIEGTTPDLTVSEANGNISITVALANLSTGISLRDHHMRDKYLEIPRFPTAVLTVSRAALQVPAPGTQAEADVPATLTLHGQSRPVTVHYSTKSEGNSFSTVGKFRINMNDFGISVPTYLGVTVKPDIDVNASFRALGT
ncbi:MAG: YceI family protein [Polyangiaceae bacterium]|nr:YceI family protein [Polyangiaceae bacterium]